MSKWVVLVFWVLVAGSGAGPSGKLMGATWCSSPSIAVASRSASSTRSNPTKTDFLPALIDRSPPLTTVDTLPAMNDQDSNCYPEATC